MDLAFNSHNLRRGSVQESAFGVRKFNFNILLIYSIEKIEQYIVFLWGNLKKI